MSSTNTEMDTEMANRSDATTSSNPDNNLRGLLSLARQLINEGKPSLALQAVMTAVRSDGGDESVYQTLHRAREQYRNKLQANAAADQLASLFAECAIAEAQPSKPESLQLDMGGPPVAPDAYETSILARTGRKQLVMDAFLDGSSFICLQCGGLVSNNRREEHFAYWCSQS